MTLIDGAQVDIKCPKCGHKIKQLLARLKRDPTLICPACQQPVKIDAAGLRQNLAGAEAALAELQQKIKDLGKR